MKDTKEATDLLIPALWLTIGVGEICCLFLGEEKAVRDLGALLLVPSR